MTLLEVTGLTAGYGAAQVLHGIDLRVDEGQVVVVLGANGAGKTTLMRSLAGTIGRRGEVSLGGRKLPAGSPDGALRRGMSLVPQGRGTLTALTVLDNLRIGAVTRSDKAGVTADIEHWLEVFPRLRDRRQQVAGTLSGGEQQMLAIARALMSRPQLLLCDEISLGLAPKIVQELFQTLRTVNAESDTALLLVEQHAELALELASYVYLLEVGTVAASGPAQGFQDNEAIRRSYLGY